MLMQMETQAIASPCEEFIRNTLSVKSRSCFELLTHRRAVAIESTHEVLCWQMTGRINKSLLHEKSWSQSRINRRQKLLQSFNTWEFDSHKICFCDAVYLASTVLHGYEVAQVKHIPEANIEMFVNSALSGYREVEYHNWIHGFDVFYRVHHMIQKTKAKMVMSSLDAFGLALAALAHDIDHPGHDNSFEVNTKTERAERYQCKSVLENHHLELALGLFESSSMAAYFTEPEMERSRKVFKHAILATDMAHHNSVVGSVKNLPTFHSEDAPICVGSCVLHAADIGAQTLPHKVASKFENSCFAEFHAQHLREVKLGLPSPTCRINLTTTAKRVSEQLFFLKIFVKPLFTMLHDLFGGLEEPLGYLDENLNRLEDAKAA